MTRGDAGAVPSDRAGHPSIDGPRTIRTDGEPEAGRSTDGLTVDVGRQLILRADPPSARLEPFRLVGRERELATLREAVGTSEIDGRSIVIGGDAGSGKTAVLAAFRAHLRVVGVTVVDGACVEIESRRPFGAFADVIASCERVFGRERVERSLTENGITVDQLMRPGAPASGARRGDRYQMHSALLGLFTDLTQEGQLAVLIEDLHWADEASLELFGYLARRLRSRPMLLVATYRSDELDRRHPLRAALAELRKARLIEDLQLAPLDSDGTGELIKARLALRDAAPLDVREFGDLVHARCEGNPLHTEETLDTLRQGGHLRYAEGAWTCDVLRILDAIPTNVADGVVGRWAGLSTAAQQVLLVASVAGHRLDIELLANVSGNSPQALGPLIHEAIDARLVRDETSDEPLRFRHALTREALQRQLLRSERTALHRTIAAFFEHRGETVPVRPAELAYHLEESGEAARATRYHEMAASEAAAMTDFASASRSIERAIATAADGDVEQGRRQLALVDYLRLRGDNPRAMRAANAALEIGQRIGDDRLQARALLALQAGHTRNSDVAQGQDLRQRAVVLLEPLGPTQELARAYSSSAGGAARLGDATAAMAFAELARKTATTLALPAELSFATLQISIAMWTQGRFDEATAVCREAVEIARRAGLIDELYAALMTLRVLLLATGASAEEQRDLQLQMRAVARAHGLGSQEWMSREIDCLMGDGDWDDVLKLFRQLPEPGRSDYDQPLLMATFIAVARRGPAEMGEMDGVRLRTKYGYSTPAATWSAELLLLAHRQSEAAALATTISEDEVNRTYWGLKPASVVHAIGLFAARECGDAAAREFFLSSLLRERPLPASPNHNRRHIALAQGDIAEAEGDIDTALAAYAVALAEAERAKYDYSSVMLFISLLRQRRAELYLRATPPDEDAAQAELDALLPYWQKANATWYLGQLRTWAQKLGLSFPRVDEPLAVSASAPKQLTRRELEIARLVAEGLTNREIGTRLTLSVRTAESHVEQIRTKLGFRTRAQIAAWITQRYGSARTH